MHSHWQNWLIPLCPTLLFPSRKCRVLLMQQQPPSLSWHQPTEKNSFQNDQETSKILRKYSFTFAWGFAATYQWLGRDIVSFDFSLSFKEWCSQFAFLTQWSAKPPTLMSSTGAILSQLFLCAIIQIDMGTYGLWLCSKFKLNLK